MSSRMSVPLLATLLACLDWVPLVSAQQPGYPKSDALRTTSLAFTSPPPSFMFLSIASEPEGECKRPIVCFGLRPAADEYKYTYFVVFKTDRTRKWESAWSVDGGATGLFIGEATLNQIELSFGEDPSAKKVMVSYRAAWNEKTGVLTRESLTIDDVVYMKDGPRVFLCDLTAEKPTFRPLKVALPDMAPKVDSDVETMSAALIESLREVAKSSHEVKEIFEGPSKK